MKRSPLINLYPPILPTAELILMIAVFLERYIFLKDKKLPLLIAVWVLGTYVFDVFKFYGYLWINSPVKRCGKTLLLDILSHICCHSTRRLSNLTEAVTFRVADKRQTLILDELENLRSEDREKYGAIMSLINVGFQAGAVVPRMEKVHGKFEVREFNAFCPKAFAGISRVHDTISDRSFKIPMVRKRKDEKIERFNFRKLQGEIEQLKKELQLWAEARREVITQTYDALDEIPGLESVDDRFKDISEPIFAVVSFACSENLNGGQQIMNEVKEDLISLLLHMAGKRAEGERREAIEAFIPLAEKILEGGKEKFIRSRDLLDEVISVEELSWIPSMKALATLLGKFDLSSRQDKSGKSMGYRITKEWVDDLKNRYFSI